MSVRHRVWTWIFSAHRTRTDHWSDLELGENTTQDNETATQRESRRRALELARVWTDAGIH